MSQFKHWLLLLIGGALALVLLYVAFVLIFMDFVVDLWWFSSLGYGAYFWLRLTYRYLVFLFFTTLFFLTFFLNFWVASRYLGAARPALDETAAGLKRYRELLRSFRAGSLKVYTPFSLLLAVLLALPLYQRWEETLLYLFAPATGLQDPVFGKDISYYLFSLPIYLLLVHRLVVALLLLFLGLLLLYRLERRLLAQQEQRLPRGAKVHLSFLVMLLFLVGAWSFLLERHSLLYVNKHQALFFGPGFVEMWVILPLIWGSMALLFGTGLVLIFYLNTRQGLKPLICLSAAFLLSLLARYSDFLPDLVQEYVVAPNEIVRERPYIERNIKATLTAYDLDRVETREFQMDRATKDLVTPELRAALRNIPIWDREILLDVYEQLQELRTYYRFSSVDVDRYTVRGVCQQVFLAPRELNLEQLPPGVRNWINLRLKYTHGYGAVMTPAAQAGEEPLTWFLKDIPPRSALDFQIAEPGIYFGLEKLEHIIVPNKCREIDYPLGDDFKLTDYRGRDGIPMSSLIRKLVFARYFKEKDIFFTVETRPDSRLLFRRNIHERIKTLTPFFLLDQDPYIVATPQNLYWIQDAYTFSDRYPYSQSYDQRFNYIRNSVKIVVDAYNGSVDYYVADERDPIIQGYRRMYPELLKSLRQLPEALRAHLRYPKDLFDIQLAIYAKYHQQDPDEFYKQEDIWEFPDIKHFGKVTKITPYYLTLNLIDPQKFEFILLAPLTPKARTNLRALVAVGCDEPNYGRIVVYSFPKGTLVHGPTHADAFIDQDTGISELFTLWRQAGSEVERGKMILLPVAGAVLYIQPVYMKAKLGAGIPQLKRVIVNKEELVVMEPSLEKGVAALERRLKEVSGRLLSPRRGESFSPVPESKLPERH
jgi:uncharacterized membrane protein (UPF0182 family)